MRACIQRVTEAKVTVAGEVVGQIGAGLAVLVGVAHADTPQEVAWMAEKLVELRIFEDADGKMNLSLRDIGGALLLISQFTLLGECRKGRRPSFIAAAPPELAERLYLDLAAAIASRGVKVETGRFRANMQVALVNDGPVTLLLDSQRD
jgi:D-tyrosyl-tRNA(Tyr) deacylase